MHDDRNAGTKLPVFASLLLVPTIFILHNVFFFKSLLFYAKVYVLCAVYLLLPLALYLLLHKLLKRPKDTSALAAMLLSLLFFFFGAIQDFLLAQPLIGFLGKTYVLPLLFLAPVFYLFIKTPKVGKAQRFIATLLLLLFLSEVILLIAGLPAFGNLLEAKEKIALVSPKGKQKNEPFNVYHIIFDGYTNSPTMQRLFHFQNPIDSFLRQKGFYVAENTKSNYNFTPYSLAATLNLSYLSLEQKQLERNFKHYLQGAKVYQQNAVFRFFKNQGYDVTHFSLLDDYDFLDKLGTFVPKSPYYSLRNQTLERIFLNPWLWQKASATAAGRLPDRILENLQAYIDYNRQAAAHVLQTKNDEKKQFNFTHFLLPHEPYVFTKPSIDSLRLNDLMNASQGYRKQVEYANTLMIKLVTALQKNNHNIIVIQGDHGFRDYDRANYPRLLQNEALNAIYFPDRDYRLLYDSISLVNTYRVLFDHYFQQHLPLLKDNYFIPVE